MGWTKPQKILDKKDLNVNFAKKFKSNIDNGAANHDNKTNKLWRHMRIIMKIIILSKVENEYWM